MAEVEIHAVPEDSIVIFRNLTLPDDAGAVEAMMGTLRDAIGHDRWAVLHVQDGTSKVEVLGPDDSLPDWVLRKLAEKAELVELAKSRTPSVPGGQPMTLPPLPSVD